MMHQYEDSLRATKRLLDAVGEGGWARWMETCIGRWQAAHDTACHLSAYGGMGSFNDILICEANGHKVTRLQEPWANTLFDWLRALCAFLARNPDRAHTATDLADAIGRYDAPLSAFAGAGTAASSRRGSGSDGAELHGWRCLRCGHSEVSRWNIEALVADGLIPIMVLKACEAVALQAVVDQILSGDIEGLAREREEVVLAVSASGIVVNDREGWMRPCPNCGTDDTAACRWKWTSKNGARFQLLANTLSQRA